MIQKAFVQPDASWSRKRSEMIVIRIQNQITNRKISRTTIIASGSPKVEAIGIKRSFLGGPGSDQPGLSPVEATTALPVAAFDYPSNQPGSLARTRPTRPGPLSPGPSLNEGLGPSRTGLSRRLRKLNSSAGDGSAPVAVTDTWNASIARGAIAYKAKTANGATTYRIRAGALSLGKASLIATKGAKSVSLGSITSRFVSGRGGEVSVKADGRHGMDVLRVTDPAVDAKARTATASLVLTARAAKVLNKAFSTTAFQAGQKFGTVTVTAPPAV